MKKTLITGSTGFVGINLIKYLAINAEASLLFVNRKNVYGGENSYTYTDFFNGDVSAHHYIHLAGKAHDLKQTSDDEEYFKVNFELTKSIFDRFLKDREAETFIYISSVKAAKDSINEVLTEDALPDPKTAYGRSKRKAEEYLMNNVPADKNVYILRPCMIHGPSNKGNLNLLYNMISKGIPYPLGAFENKRSFLSIENLCFLIHQLIKRPIESGIYNVADDKPISTNELVKLMGDSMGKKATILTLPKKVILGLVRMGDVFRLPINSERLQKLTEDYVVSNKKLLENMTVELPLSSNEGLRQTFNSFKK
ncbi:NAD-dependent epimerase/dehydratase family protein [Anditalea andensis]|uniref:Dehydratase n=1 Tax=Anditalea andensis TaxID=1048983 RepID=A0A074KWP2_9BACT|nr:NAD-dependent epimerase/dehydratase family protein [Anditalea andensis]KEO72600.1 dehydratase [Anditalea andensis]